MAFDPSELVCSSCLPPSAGAPECSKHGKDYVVWKCRYCCNEALFL